MPRGWAQISGCRLRRNGNTRREPTQQQAAFGAIILMMPANMSMSMIRHQRKHSIFHGRNIRAMTVMRSLPRSAVSARMPSGCTTCWAMCGNGARTCMSAMRIKTMLAAIRSSPAAARIGCCAAAVGTTFRGTCVPRVATAARRPAATASSGFAS